MTYIKKFVIYFSLLLLFSSFLPINKLEASNSLAAISTENLKDIDSYSLVLQHLLEKNEITPQQATTFVHSTTSVLGNSSVTLPAPGKGTNSYLPIAATFFPYRERVPGILSALNSMSLGNSLYHFLETKTNDRYGGVQRIVVSKAGYNQASGFIKLPTALKTTQDVANKNTGHQNDVPYIMWGVYNPSQGADCGLFYDASKGGWKIFICTTKGYWGEGKKIISRNSTPFTTIKVLDNAIQLIVYNSKDWSVIDSATWQLPKHGFSLSGKNTSIYRAVSIAQHKFNLTNGAYMSNVQWQDVCLYKNKCDQWTAQVTNGTPYISPQVAASKVKVSVKNNYYDDSVSIFLR